MLHLSIGATRGLLGCNHTQFLKVEAIFHSTYKKNTVHISSYWLYQISHILTTSIHISSVFKYMLFSLCVASVTSKLVSKWNILKKEDLKKMKTLFKNYDIKNINQSTYSQMKQWHNVVNIYIKIFQIVNSFLPSIIRKQRPAVFQ